MSVAERIEAAATLDDLAAAAGEIDGRVLAEHAAGRPAHELAAQASALNARLHRRLWTLLAPPAWVANSALLVMGSEGRHEQLLKTDQDNGLVLRDGFAAPGLEAACEAFSAALARLGWPPCPGGIMVTNPLWCQPLAAFRGAIRDWLLADDPEGPMRLAIFCDAACVAGDAALLADAKAFLDGLVSDSDAYLARFASAADAFAEPHDRLHFLNWFGAHREAPALDLKKLGIFPIVHGVRALALQHRVRDLGTAGRLHGLAERGALPAATARELLHALHALMALRLAHQLRCRERGLPVDNTVHPDALASAEREALDGALGVVRRWRTWLGQHFRFDLL